MPCAAGGSFGAFMSHEALMHVGNMADGGVLALFGQGKVRRGLGLLHLQIGLLLGSLIIGFIAACCWVAPAAGRAASSISMQLVLLVQRGSRQSAPRAGSAPAGCRQELQQHLELLGLHGRHIDPGANRHVDIHVGDIDLLGPHHLFCRRGSPGTICSGLLRITWARCWIRHFGQFVAAA